MASLGQELKRTREEKGISLHEIANTTHIGVRFLQAIENDSYDILPGGVFNKAFVRKFAKQVGFDEEQAVKLYEEQLEEMGGEPQRRYYTGIDDIDSRPSSGNGWLITVLTFVLLAAGAYLAYEYFKTPAPEGSSGDSASIPSTPVVESTATPSPTVSTEGAPGGAQGAMRVQLIAGSSECWVRSKIDEANPEETILQPGSVREFNANEKIVFDLGNLASLKIAVNGRRLSNSKLAPNLKGVVAKNVTISKDNYQQFVE